MKQHPKKLWSYWIHNQHSRWHRHTTIWQVVPKKYAVGKGGGGDLAIRMIWKNTADKGIGSMKVGDVRVYDSPTMLKHELWQPISKDDIALLLLQMLDEP